MSFGINIANAQAVCFPTCEVDDAKFLVLAGTNLETLAGDTIQIQFRSPGDAPTLSIGIFDGDEAGNWDVGNVAIRFELYADPNGDGSGVDNPDNLIEEFGDDETLANNAWSDFTVENSPAALSPNGDYFYTLQVTNTDPNVLMVNAFKVRAGPGALAIQPRAFAIQSSVQGLGDAEIVYPNFPDTSTTTNDGNYTFHLNVPEPLIGADPASFFSIWDGDADFGSRDCVDLDTDDADTPGLNEADPLDLIDDTDFVPPWAVGTQSVPEGMATSSLSCSSGEGTTTGDPADDSSNTFLVRSPSVNYTVETPSGSPFPNNNPSGNTEWEQFRIDTDSANAADYTIAGDSLEQGIYKVSLDGLDLQNLMAFRFFNDAICVNEDGTPCEPPMCPANAKSTDEGCLVCEGLDWATDGAGNALSAGDILTDQFADLGMTVSSSNSAHPVMVFDTTNPTGGDTDLGTPNEDFGGPGIGDGGSEGAAGENAVSLGNTLILSTDGDSSDPDDHAGGGTMTFTFESSVNVGRLTVLDIEESGGTVVAYSDTAGTNELASFPIENVGNNGVQRINVDTGGVRRIDVNFVGSGSVAGLVVCPEPQEECVECEDGVTSLTIEHDRSENDVHMRIWEYVNGGWSVILNTEANGDPMVAAGDDVSFDVSDGASYVAVQIKDNVGHHNWFTKGKIKVDCSEEVGAGTTFGKFPDYIAFTVVASESQAGPICPISTEPPGGDAQGCTPGYWKQFHHFDDWVGVSPFDSFDAIFGVNAGNITMWQAVTAHGGGLNALNRHAAAAYLNASNPDVNYAQLPTPEEVVALVQDAYNGGDVEGTKDLLDQLNNAGCPLGNGGGGGGNGNHNGNSNDNSNGNHNGNDNRKRRGGYGNSNRHYGGYDRGSNRHYGGYRNANRHYGGYSRSNRGGHGYGYSRDHRRGGYGSSRHSRRGGHWRR